VIMELSLKCKRCCLALFLPLILIGFFSASTTRAQTDLFPIYPSIQPNVDFWTKIFTEYATHQGVLHDRENLNIIYGTIELENPDLPAGRAINEERINQAKNKYKAILSKLMRGEPPVGPQQKHVAKLFGPRARPADFQEAMHNIRCQTGQKDRFRDGIIRSGALLADIQRILREYGLPEDLAYLPHVESSFDTQAYSKAGAAGIWQFTHATGKRYLQIDYTIDARRDPILSSHAAAQLLRYNHQVLGSWPMAITAYNHGLNGMLQAQGSHGSYENIFKSYRSRIFKFASRNFYAEFLSARQVAQNYHQYFGNLKLLPPLKSREIVLAGFVSLPEIARHLAVDPEELHYLNPALRRPVVLGQKYIPKGYRLRLPERGDDDWQHLVAELPEKFYKPDQKHSRIYTVKKGDTAGKIARKHGVKLNDLMAANNLDSRATVYVNQNLKIPLSKEGPVQIAKLVPPEPARPTAPLLTNPASLPQHPPETLAVASGTDLPAPQIETAETEASSLLASVEPYHPEEKKATESLPNESTAATIEKEPPTQDLPPGSAESERSGSPEAEQLGPESTAVAHLPGDPEAGRNPLADLSALMNPDIIQGHFAVERVWTQNGQSLGIIRVEVEETLGHYAEWLGVSARDIRRLNGLHHGALLHLNQKIKIPLHRVNQAQFEEKRFEYHKELAEDFFGSYRIETVRIYSIEKGDTIWSLSREKFEIPLWLIKRCNDSVDLSALLPSQQLLIPVVERTDASENAKLPLPLDFVRV
jgi:membrane-bound lytic murein transglycosylase D